MSEASKKLIPGRNTGVAFVRSDLSEKFDSYDLVMDCLEGSKAIKEKSTIYLPRPDPYNKSEENLARYDNYLLRAVFYNVTQRTALGLQGQIFLRPPIIEHPTILKNVVTDSNGAGISLEQLARDLQWLVTSCGRAGLFVDYPPTKGTATKAELESGNIRPTINIYGPKCVINWRSKVVGSKSILNLVVLYEEYTVEDNGFETKIGVQFRELRLSENGIYTVQLWRAKGGPQADDFEKFGDAYTPLGGDGKPLDSIPFTFIGSKNNEPSIDPAPLLDMAEINIAHYRNSADYEEMVYVVGQPMIVISGLPQSWYEEVLGKKIPFGSRVGLPLPVGGTAELLQVEPNTSAKEAMDHKERQMVSLGAKIVEQREVQRTATEAGNETASEESTLSAIAKNVSAAIQWALEWCAFFLNVPETGIKFELNSDFELSRMTSDEINSVIASWQDNAISWTEMRATLRKAGRATLDDKKAKEEIEKDQTSAIERAAIEAGRIAEETGAMDDNGT